MGEGGIPISFSVVDSNRAEQYQVLRQVRIQGLRDHLHELQGARGGFSAWVAGITRYGTRAVLMWMLNNPDELSGKMLIVVQWVDAD